MDAGAKALSQALKVNKTLEYLELSLCGILHEGARFLSVSLQVNKTLKEINLQGNGIDTH